VVNLTRCARPGVVLIGVRHHHDNQPPIVTLAGHRPIARSAMPGTLCDASHPERCLAEPTQGL